MNHSTQTPDLSVTTGSAVESRYQPSLSISPLISTKIITVSFIAACAVVLIHTKPIGFEFIDDSFRVARTLCDFFLTRMTRFAVPMFFTISGYLFAIKTNLGKQQGWYSMSLKKRIRTLLLPYLIWCTIYAFTYLPFKILGNILADRDLISFMETNLKHPICSVWNFGRIYGLDIFYFPMARSLWYVRNLLLLFLISPLFFLLFRKKSIANVYLMLAFILIFFQKQFPSSWNLECGFSLRGLFFFPLGIYFAFFPVRHDRFQIFRTMLPALWIIVAIAETFFSNHSVFLEQVFRTFNGLFGIGAIWCLTDFFPAILNIGRKEYAKDTFFLYAIHKDILTILFCNQVEKILFYKFHIPVAGLLLLSASGTILLSLFIAEFLKRFLPKAYRILSGGR